MSDFRREHFSDRQMNAVQENVSERISALQRSPFTDGELHSLEFTASTLTQTFPHKLKRKHAGVFISLPIPSAVFYETAILTTDPNYMDHVRITANVACKVKVWVF